MTKRISLLLVIVVVCNVLGNLALSWGMKRVPAQAGPIEWLIQPAVVGGIALLIVWTLSRLALLKLADLSFVLPVTAIGYVLNAALGASLLGEHVSLQRWAGTILIVAGAALVALRTSSARTVEDTRS